MGEQPSGEKALSEQRITRSQLKRQKTVEIAVLTIFKRDLGHMNSMRAMDMPSDEICENAKVLDAADPPMTTSQPKSTQAAMEIGALDETAQDTNDGTVGEEEVEAGDGDGDGF